MRGVFCVLLFAAAFPARPETNLERGKRVVDEAVAALGGDRFLNMRNRVEDGRAYSFYREQVSGLSIARIYTRYLPDVSDTAHTLAIEEREFFGKKQESSVLFTPSDAYGITFRGARPLLADQFARYKETTLRSVLYILKVRLHEKGMIFESRGADVILNRPVEIVDITDADNLTTTVYFDQTNKWPLRQVFYRRDPKTRERDEETTTFSKYRETGGVQWPMDIHRERNGDKIFELFCDLSEINAKKVPDTLFMLPSAIKLLKPE